MVLTVAKHVTIFDSPLHDTCATLFFLDVRCYLQLMVSGCSLWLQAASNIVQELKRCRSMAVEMVRLIDLTTHPFSLSDTTKNISKSVLTFRTFAKGGLRKLSLQIHRHPQSLQSMPLSMASLGMAGRMRSGRLAMAG